MERRKCLHQTNGGAARSWFDTGVFCVETITPNAFSIAGGHSMCIWGAQFSSSTLGCVEVVTASNSLISERQM